MENIDNDNFERLIAGLGRLPRARPTRDLLPGIEARLVRPEAEVIPPQQWRTLAAAAILLLLLNAVALTYYAGQTDGQDEALALISDYYPY